MIIRRPIARRHAAERVAIVALLVVAVARGTLLTDVTGASDALDRLSSGADQFPSDFFVEARRRVRFRRGWGSAPPPPSAASRGPAGGRHRRRDRQEAGGAGKERKEAPNDRETPNEGAGAGEHVTDTDDVVEVPTSRASPKSAGRGGEGDPAEVLPPTSPLVDDRRTSADVVDDRRTSSESVERDRFPREPQPQPASSDLEPFRRREQPRRDRPVPAVDSTAEAQAEARREAERAEDLREIMEEALGRAGVPEHAGSTGATHRRRRRKPPDPNASVDAFVAAATAGDAAEDTRTADGDAAEDTRARPAAVVAGGASASISRVSAGRLSANVRQTTDDGGFPSGRRREEGSDFSSVDLTVGDALRPGAPPEDLDDAGDDGVRSADARTTPRARANRARRGGDGGDGETHAARAVEAEPLAVSSVDGIAAADDFDKMASLLEAQREQLDLLRRDNDAWEMAREYRKKSSRINDVARDVLKGMDVLERVESRASEALSRGNASAASSRRAGGGVMTAQEAILEGRVATATGEKTPARPDVADGVGDDESNASIRRERAAAAKREKQMRARAEKRQTAEATEAAAAEAAERGDPLEALRLRLKIPKHLVVQEAAASTEGGDQEKEKAAGEATGERRGRHRKRREADATGFVTIADQDLKESWAQGAEM